MFWTSVSELEIYKEITIGAGFYGLKHARKSFDNFL